jgi:hypothetical protein
MERVAFLVEQGGQRIDALLNPETLEVTRLAGVRSRGIETGRLTGAGLADDPLHLTGGGRTELTLDLLFDVELAEGEGRSPDVRALTRPLWQLAENSSVEEGTVRPPLVRFVWGKSWNLPGVVAAVAERFDRFDAGGVPGRSWLRLRFRRVADSATQADAEYERLVAEAEAAPPVAPAATAGAEPGRVVVAVGHGTRPGGGPATRFDLLAHDGLGNPFLWRLLAAHNAVEDPLRVPAGTVLAVPPGAAPPPGPVGGAGAIPPRVP